MMKTPENWDDLLNLEYRSPKKGDRLLRRADDPTSGVQFTEQPISRHVFQWEGFMRAGAGLIELCGQDGYEQNRDYVIYPILFDYRHGLELAMKWIILMYGGQGLPSVKVSHDLMSLWCRCREIMQEYETYDKESADIVEKIVKEFHDLDKDGITFRYGWSKGGKHIYLPSHLVDLENIRDVMEGIANYFTGIDGWLDHLQSAGPEYP